MSGKTALLLAVIGISGMFGALIMILLNSPLLGGAGGMEGVFTWSAVFVFAVFIFGTGIARYILP